MEKKIELENGSNLVFTGGHASDADGLVTIGRPLTSNEPNARMLIMKFGDKKECSMEKTFKIEEFIRNNKRINKLLAKQEIELEEIERKFIIMSRIAVLLSRKGLIAGVTIYPSECNAGSFCQISVQDAKSIAVLESLDDHEVTKQELLDWWSVIENGVE